jgi:hypothetical protein
LRRWIDVEIPIGIRIRRGWAWKSGPYARLKRATLHGRKLALASTGDLIEAITRRNLKKQNNTPIKSSPAFEQATLTEIINMALIKNYMPPSRENWEWVVYLFQFFPVV